MAKSKDNSLLIVLVLAIGIAGLILLLRRRAAPVSMALAAPAPAAPSMTYDNEETIEFPEGFDPLTLMPKKIVVHRKAIVKR